MWPPQDELARHDGACVRSPLRHSLTHSECARSLAYRAPSPAPPWRASRLSGQNPFLARHEQFDRVGSTNDVVRDWLAAGDPEVCLAVAREQTAGRGRSGRTWFAPRDAALLLSLGFRPTWLAPDRVWQLAAIVSLAMADAAGAVTGLPDDVIWLKWPNDLVVERDGTILKVGGVLGETEGLGTADPRAIVGIGINTDWRADDFPPELAPTMTSLRALCADPNLDVIGLLAVFIERLGERFEVLRTGRFDAAGWSSRQVTTARTIQLEGAAGVDVVEALGVDAQTGALVVADPGVANGQRQVLVGEVRRVRLAGSVTASV
jgi:BirA family transcriptional regulator, biotin operon repressor / biotin---[acetyl-CoA-carboxylase] ligase